MPPRFQCRCLLGHRVHVPFVDVLPGFCGATSVPHISILCTGYYAGSQDYYNHQSLCWPGSVENGCFENTTGPLQEPVTGLDLHKGREVFNSTEYSTIFYTDEASAVIAAHAAKYAVSSQGDRVTMSTPLFLYLPYQVSLPGQDAIVRREIS